ncbi:hypothetical protein DFH06DRAFT_1177097 [Mycena polygramma]|nr:hypothetical protein DFH06DRAFT_1177097 [Mycena polygramma]
MLPILFFVPSSLLSCSWVARLGLNGGNRFFLLTAYHPIEDSYFPREYSSGGRAAYSLAVDVLLWRGGLLGFPSLITANMTGRNPSPVQWAAASDLVFPEMSTNTSTASWAPLENTVHVDRLAVDSKLVGKVLEGRISQEGCVCGLCK